MVIDSFGYCVNSAGTWPYAGFDNPGQPIDAAAVKDVRNRLIRARDLFAFLALAEPAHMTVTPPAQTDNEPTCFAALRTRFPIPDSVPVRELGKACVMETVRELANAHLIFANEFVLDAYAYRFNPTVRDGVSYQLTGKLIMEKEVELLQKAKAQFELAAGVLVHSLNVDYGGSDGARIGDFFTDQEYDLFGAISERLVTTVTEIANRQRRLDWANQQGDKAAVALYEQAYTTQYLSMIALAEQAQRNNKTILDHNGWEQTANLQRLHAEMQTVRVGSDPFGFPQSYVPLSKYSCLTTDVFFPHIDAATKAEDTARAEIQKYQQNDDDLTTRLGLIDDKYDAQLTELCGPDPEKTWEICEEPGREGGLVAQNRIDLFTAGNHRQATETALANNLQKITDLQATNAAVRVQMLGAAQEVSAIEIAKGMENAEKCTEAQISTVSKDTIYRKIEQKTEKSFLEKAFSVVKGVVVAAAAIVGTVVSFGAGAPALIPAAAVVKDEIDNFNGNKRTVRETINQTTETQASQSSCTFDPEQAILGSLNSQQSLIQAVADANIRGIQSDFEVRDLLRGHALLMIEFDNTILEWNKRIQEHEYLRNRYHTLINARSRSQAEIVNGYLNTPAYRILRDQAVIEAEQKVEYAIQYAYLAAKSIEYEYARPMAQWPVSGNVGPFDIYLARTAQNVENYRLYLTRIKTAFGAFAPSPKTPVIRLASDVAPQGQSFPAWLKGYLNPTTNMITIPFETTLAMKNSQGEHIFNVDRFNERITGITNQDVDACTPWFVGKGLQCDIRMDVTPALLKAPTIGLEHRSPGQYRNAQGEIVYYTPGVVQLSESESRPHLLLESTKAGLSCKVNGNVVVEQSETQNGELFSRSVAAGWVFTLDLNENAALRQNIDTITDIVISMDTISFKQQVAGEAASE